MEDFYSYNINNVIDELNNKKNELNTKGRTILLPIFMFLFGLAFILQLTVIPLETPYIWITVLVLLVIIALATIIKNAVVHSKVKNTYLNNEVIKLYNYEHEMKAQYHKKYKTTNEFNKQMGMFTRYCSVSNKYMIQLDEQTKILDTTLQTSSGNSSYIHFQGIYVQFEQPGYSIFQVRSNGKPQLKNHKFEKQPDEDIRVYKLENSDHIRFNYRSVLNALEDYKKVYIASNKKEVHIAFSPFKAKFNHKVYTHENFKEYYHQFEELLNKILLLKDVVSMVNE